MTLGRNMMTNSPGCRKYWMKCKIQVAMANLEFTAMRKMILNKPVITKQEM